MYSVVGYLSKVVKILQVRDHKTSFSGLATPKMKERSSKAVVMSVVSGCADNFRVGNPELNF